MNRKMLQLASLTAGFAGAFPGQQYASHMLQQQAAAGIRASIEEEERKKKEKSKWYKPRNLLATAVETAGSALGTTLGGPAGTVAGGTLGGAAGAGIRGDDVGEGALSGGIGGIAGETALANPFVRSGINVGAQTLGAAIRGQDHREAFQGALAGEAIGHGMGYVQDRYMQRLPEDQGDWTPRQQFGAQFLSDLSGNLAQQAETHAQQRMYGGNPYQMQVDPKAAIGMTGDQYQSMVDSHMSVADRIEAAKHRKEEIKAQKLEMDIKREEARLRHDEQKEIEQMRALLGMGRDTHKAGLDVAVDEEMGKRSLRESQTRVHDVRANEVLPEQARAAGASADLATVRAQELVPAQADAARALADQRSARTQQILSPQEEAQPPRQGEPRQRVIHVGNMPMNAIADENAGGWLFTGAADSQERQSPKDAINEFVKMGLGSNKIADALSLGVSKGEIDPDGAQEAYDTFVGQPKRGGPVVIDVSKAPEPTSGWPMIEIGGQKIKQVGRTFPVDGKFYPIVEHNGQRKVLTGYEE